MEFAKRKSTKSLTEIPKCRRVLLVCIMNKNSVIISLEYIHSLFSKFGKINKILIFEKAKIWKSFIEMACEKEALEAKTALDNYRIFDDESFINIFFSNLETLNLNSTTIDGIDYNKPPNNFEVKQPEFAGRSSSKRALTMKMESNIQPIDKIFLMKSESNERIRENTSLEKKIEEKFDNSQVCNVPTSVIHIKGLNIKEMKLAFLKNLFSNFGNVKKIIFFKEIGSALLEFTLKEFAFSAIKFLNNLMFLGTTLQIKFSTYHSLSVNNNGNMIEKPIYQNQEIYKADKSEFRFKADKNLKANPPSEVIHVSNIKPEYFKENYLLNLFSQYGTIVTMKMLNEKEKKFMCLIKYRDIEESMRVIAFLHNHEIDGRKLQISFSKSKL